MQLQTGRQLLDGLQAQINADEERYYALLAQIEDLREQADVSEDSLDDTGESAGEPDTGPDQQIAALEAQAQAVAARLEGERQAYTLGQAGIEVVHREMDSVQAELTAAKNQIDAAEAELAAAPAKLSSGQAQINSGWNELRSQEQKLVDGEAEIVSNEAKLVDAKKEYEEGKAEAEAEIADGEKKIAEAEADIEDIELPKWYVYDRSTLIEYSGFGENAQRLFAVQRNST